ncbi:translocase of chloroplast 120, chloroplastic-like protein [Tanacetum coccineum]
MPKFIPDDICELILIRLDVEDLIRCMKVCKSWKSLISYSHFVKAQHTRQVNLSPYRMGIIPNYLSKYGLEHYMVGSSNGLAYINSFDGDEIIVANPLTREERMLQKLPVSPVRSCWGFGYDALRDDYKVVFGAVEGKQRVRVAVLKVKPGDMELLTDVESTSGTDARDQASELVLVDGKQDGAEVVGVADDQNSNEPDVLENNRVIGVGVNENNEGSKGILEDVHKISWITEQPDGEISGEVNGDQLHEDMNGKDVLKVEQNEEVVPKHFKPSSSAIHEPEVERQPSFDDKVSESVADSSKIREQNDEDKPLNKELESRPVIGVSLSTAKSVAPTPIAVPNYKDDPKPKETPTPNSRPNTPPTLRPFLAPNQVIDEPTNGEAEENDKIREKLQMIRVKFLRLVQRLGQTHNVVVEQVLYRLGLVEQLRGRTGGRVAAFSFERASAMAEQLEVAGKNHSSFRAPSWFLGKRVLGKGIKVRVINTLGLLPFWADQRKNQKILQFVKKFIQKSPPDIVLYLDRLDMQSRDDMPLLWTITDIFGQSIWFNAIVVLTHAASAPPEGPNVENHSACRTNRNGQRVLPNGQVWKPHLLLLSFASKILVEANMLLKLQVSPPGKPFAARSRAPPLPYILSTLLQSRPQLKLPQEQFGDDNDDALDDDIDYKEQKTSYYYELEYREKLFMKKKLKEEKKRRKMMKKMAEAAKIFPTELTDNNVEEDSSAAATVPVAVQDMTTCFV